MTFLSIGPARARPLPTRVAARMNCGLLMKQVSQKCVESANFFSLLRKKCHPPRAELPGWGPLAANTGCPGAPRLAEPAKFLTSGKSADPMAGSRLTGEGWRGGFLAHWRQGEGVRCGGRFCDIGSFGQVAGLSKRFRFARRLRARATAGWRTTRPARNDESMDQEAFRRSTRGSDRRSSGALNPGFVSSSSGVVAGHRERSTVSA